MKIFEKVWKKKVSVSEKKISAPIPIPKLDLGFGTVTKTLFDFTVSLQTLTYQLTLSPPGRADYAQHIKYYFPPGFSDLPTAL